ncbi:MAG TPA: alpha/beta hydrolase [Holophagaceae bacterium]|nr:alpha/beta hydrolase [Holophagaceae bacterium]
MALTHPELWIAGERQVRIPCGLVELEGSLTLPPRAEGLVLFAHGSGSSRHSPRNRFVARYLQKGGLGTLLFDLLTAREERVDAATREYRFDLELLAGRLRAATRWAAHEPDLEDLPLGLFGASTGAAAALMVAADPEARIGAVVSRGGRPDLAADALPKVAAPTLLIVGGLDPEVIELNQEALARLIHCERELRLVNGATHLFEELGALRIVAGHASDWFRTHLGRHRGPQ